MTQHIKIGAEAPRKEYAANGTQTAFPFDFAVFQATDIEVRANGVAVTAGFSVAVAADGRGTVTFAPAPASGVRVTLLRRLTIQRQTDFQEGGELRAKTLNDELDFQTASVQQVAHDASRAVRLPDSDAAGLDMRLPAASARANKVLAFDGAGAPVASAQSLAALEAGPNAAAAAQSSANAAATSATNAAASATAAAASAATISLPLAIAHGGTGSSSAAAARAALGAANVAGDTFTGNVTAPALIPNSATVPTNGVFLPAANTVGLATDSTERARFNSSGSLLLGGANSVSVAGNAPIIQANGTLGLASYRWNAGTGGGNLVLGHSRSNTQGTQSALTTGDRLGTVVFVASDGTNFVNNGATIVATVDNTVSSGITPTRMIFQVQDALGAGIEPLRLMSSGEVQVPTVGTTASAANAFIDNATNNRILRSTSSRRHKRDIETADPALTARVFELRPVWYRSRAEADDPSWGWWGLIAEEVAAVDPRLVHWSYLPEDYEDATVEPSRFDRRTTELLDADGNPIYEDVVVPARTGKRLKVGAQKVPDGVQYERLSVLLLAELKALRARVAALEAA